MGHTYAIVRNLTGQTITDPILPSSTDTNPDKNLLTEANLISHPIYNAGGQAITGIDPDIRCGSKPDRAVDLNGIATHFDYDRQCG